MTGTVIERAKADLDAGRPWKARERLRSYLTASPGDQAALDLLGRVQCEMGDLPAAGTSWMLCSRSDADTEAAIDVLRHEHLRSVNGLIDALNVRLPVEDWPPVVRDRLRTLQAEAAASGRIWDPGRRPESPTSSESEGSFRLFLAGVAVFLALVAVLTLVGAIVVIRAIV